MFPKDGIKQLKKFIKDDTILCTNFTFYLKNVNQTMKLLTKYFRVLVKKFSGNDTTYETFFVLLALKSEINLGYQQKNVEKILSYKKFLLT